MSSTEEYGAAIAEDAIAAVDDAPGDRPVTVLDVADLPPPQPLSRTLERLPELDDETVLVQRNDRAPQHLFPKLDDRGYRNATVDRGDVVVTVIWRP